VVDYQFFFRSGTSSALKDFVRKCMLFDRFLRPTATSLLNHPFITGLAMENVLDDTNEINDGLSSELDYSSSGLD